MILFVFEGVKREPDLFRTIQRLYFANRDEQIVCSYNNNIYQLYKDLQEYDGDGDIVSLLMEKFAGQADIRSRILMLLLTFRKFICSSTMTFITGIYLSKKSTGR